MAARSRSGQIQVGATVINEAAVRTLASHTCDPAVASVYLDVDGRHRPVRAEYETAFERLADDLRRRAGQRGDARLLRAVEADVGQMRQWLGNGLDRSHTRGIALFSCSDEQYFEVISLPEPVHDEVGLGPRPRITQLVAQLAHEPILVALVDRERLRLVRVVHGEGAELPSFTEAVPRAVDTSVELGSFARHSEAATHAHLRLVSEHIEAALTEPSGNRLVVGGPVEAVGALTAELPASLGERIVGRVSLPTAASVHEIVEAVLRLQENAEGVSESEVIDQLRQRAEIGEGGVLGLEATLDALASKAVASLVICEDFATPGARCPRCGHLSTGVRPCPVCGTMETPLDDVVEIAIDEAVVQRAAVRLCRRARLDGDEQIGALLRF